MDKPIYYVILAIFAFVFIAGMSGLILKHLEYPNKEARRKKLFEMLESGVITYIYFGMESKFNMRGEYEPIFCIKGDGWRYWIAAKTDYPPKDNIGDVPRNVCRLFAMMTFEEAIEFVTPVILELQEKARGGESLCAKLWKKSVPTRGVCQFGHLELVSLNL